MPRDRGFDQNASTSGTPPTTIVARKREDLTTPLHSLVSIWLESSCEREEKPAGIVADRTGWRAQRANNVKSIHDVGSQCGQGE